jgi:hypothetical protein
MLDDAGGRLHVVGHGCTSGVAGTEQQLIGDDALLAVEDGLSTEKNVPSGHVGAL